ncbi:MAG: heavy metal translocating P-type ATPase, partial [Clostridia bacterium]|nr:heavy metal translocating P-type ATPase [Clostridia bacterium]
ELVEKYSMDIYFESAGTILTLITLGKYLETKSKGKTSDAISKLVNLAPKTAIVVRDSKEVELNVEDINVGDIIVIKPGGRIPVDGVVIEGGSSIDQSSITGESIPVEKTVGDNVVSGTINKNGYFKMEARKVGNDTTLSQIIKLVEEASNSKAPIAKLADKVSGIFVPCVITIAILAAIFWIIQGQSFEFALSIGIAVLVISCPCALGLATPVAIMVGTGKGAQNGILIKSAEAIELLHLVDTVVLDKTGTITEGKPKVTDIISLVDEKDLLKVAGGLEKNSEHPLAEAIMEEIKQKQIELPEVKEFTSVSGRGVKGNIENITYFGGNIAFMKENNIDINNILEQSESLLKKGKTVLYFANENSIIGIIAVADTIKEESYKAIQELKRKNLEVVMLTGDNKIVADTIGNELEIDKVIAEVLPQDKEKEVSNLQKQGKKVAFVGDGINDSPALVKSDVGLAIGSGTDIAIESADIVLMKNNLLDVVTAISLSKAVIRNIKMNLFWAFFYNTIGIPIAAGLFYLSLGWKLNPMIGAAAMSLSSVCIVTNALRLRNFKVNYNVNNKEEDKMISRTIKIEGMQCNHCKMSVEKALSNIDGVTKVEVSLEDKSAVIESINEIDDNKIKEVIEEIGFKVI